MGQEIDLLQNYPKAKRNIQERGAEKTDADRQIARQFGKEFFDGERRHGYGGFQYHPRFWQPVVPAFRKHFQLKGKESVLDVGCAKGFMLFDLKESLPDLQLRGVDVSSYAIEQAIEEMKPCLQVADARHLPFDDNTFDVVISINTIHNLEKEDLARALQEIERVTKGKSFITVDAYRNDEEKQAMEAWNLTAKTIMHVDEWRAFFQKVGYTGDYYWFMP